MIIYIVWAIILSVHRNTVAVPDEPMSQSRGYTQSEAPPPAASYGGYGNTYASGVDKGYDDARDM